MIDLCTQHQQGGGQTTQSHSSRLTHQSVPYPHPLRDQLAPLREQARAAVTYFRPLWLQCESSLPLIPCLTSYQFLQLKNPGTLIGNFTILSYGPAIIPPSIYPDKLKNYFHAKMCSQMFIAVLFATAKARNQPKRPSVCYGLNVCVAPLSSAKELDTTQ